MVLYKECADHNLLVPDTINDVKVKCIEQGKTQVQQAEEIDITKAYVNRVIKKQDGVVNKILCR